MLFYPENVFYILDKIDLTISLNQDIAMKMKVVWLYGSKMLNQKCVIEDMSLTLNNYVLYYKNIILHVRLKNVLLVATEDSMICLLNYA